MSPGLRSRLLAGRLGRPAAVRLALVAVSAATLVAVLVAFRSGEDVGGEGGRRPAPTFSLPDTRDPAARVELAAFRGRPVVVNFWASWCVPCRNEMPAFEAAHQRFRDRVAFVGVNHQDGRTPALDLLRQTGVTYASGSDPDGKVAAAYRLIGMPSTVLVSADGHVVATHTGELSRSQLDGMIEKLVA